VAITGHLGAAKGKDHAPIVAPPPIICFGTLVVALVAERFLFGRFLLSLPSIVRYFGGSLAMSGAMLCAIAIVQILRARTALNPYHSTVHIISGGSFSRSRNPIYLGFVVIYLGVALSTGSLLALLAAPLMLLAMHYGAIRQEESYLEEKFGDEYRAYRDRVRRWI